MYQDFYGFKEMPFNITPDPKFLYLSPTHQDALQHLKFGVQQKKGFIVLIGEVGCGKTTLCRRFLSELDSEHYDTALILNPRVTETQMLKAILTDLGETKLARSQVDLVAQVNSVLLERINRGRDIVLIIDEAQNLKFEVLEQLRLLSNLETDKQKLLQIVLMGQTELKDRLAANVSRLQVINNEAAEIAADQARLRENIKALTATTEAKQLITRYVAKADTQESRLEQLEKDRRAALEEQTRLQAELNSAIRGLSFDRQLNQ